MKTILAAIAALALFASAQPSKAMLYNNFGLGGFTTDGTIGVLTTANITEWHIGISDGVASGLYFFGSNPGGNPGTLTITGTALTATKDGIFFDFSSSGASVVWSSSDINGALFVCLNGADVNFCSSPPSTLDFVNPTGVFSSGPFSGVHLLASVPAPLAGAGLPGVLAVFGAMFAWYRKRRAQISEASRALMDSLRSRTAACQ